MFHLSLCFQIESSLYNKLNEDNEKIFHPFIFIILQVLTLSSQLICVNDLHERFHQKNTYIDKKSPSLLQESATQCCFRIITGSVIYPDYESQLIRKVLLPR